MKVLPLVALLLVSGCIEREVDGDTLRFTYAWWFPVVAGVFGLVLMFFGWRQFRREGVRSRIRGVVLFLLGPMFLLAAPGPHTSPMTLDDTGFQLTVGFVFVPSEYEVVFAEQARMEVVTVERRRRDSQELVCTDHDGRTQTVPVGDQLRAALPDVLERARAAGVEVVLPR